MHRYSFYVTVVSSTVIAHAKVVPTSAAIADALAHIYGYDLENQYVKLYVTRPLDDVVHELWVRPRLDQFPHQIDSNWELVGCEVQNIGRAILIVPRRDREYAPIGVILEERIGAES